MQRDRRWNFFWLGLTGALFEFAAWLRSAAISLGIPWPLAAGNIPAE